MSKREPFILKLPDGSPINSLRTADECEAMQRQLAGEILDIEEDIEATDDHEANREWIRRANAALRFKKGTKDIVARRQQKLDRDSRPYQRYTQHLSDAVKEVVPQEAANIFKLADALNLGLRK